MSDFCMDKRPLPFENRVSRSCHICIVSNRLTPCSRCGRALIGTAEPEGNVSTQPKDKRLSLRVVSRDLQWWKLCWSPLTALREASICRAGLSLAPSWQARDRGAFDQENLFIQACSLRAVTHLLGAILLKNAHFPRRRVASCPVFGPESASYARTVPGSPLMWKLDCSIEVAGQLAVRPAAATASHLRRPRPERRAHGLDHQVQFPPVGAAINSRPPIGSGCGVGGGAPSRTCASIRCNRVWSSSE